MHIQFDESSCEMSAKSFLFHVDNCKSCMPKTGNIRELHSLLEGASTKWYWQLMEDRAEDYDFDYYTLTYVMKRAISTTESDLMKVKEIMDSDYVFDMHNLHFKLKHKRMSLSRC